MLKTLVKAITAFSLLVGTYLGYTHAFAVASTWVQVSHVKPIQARSSHQLSASAREATALAELSFGKDHWTVKAPIRYYVSERGYWMYAESYKRAEDGKQLIFEPFAIIWHSKDGKSLKTATSDKATLDFNRSIDIVKPGAGDAHVVRAEIAGHVQLRDDKGTPQNGTDDLMVTTQDPIIYDDDALLITSTGNVIIQDRDLWMTGDGLKLVLRPNPPVAPGGKPSGFTGAQTAFLNRNVHLVISDVGNTGILSGTAKPDQQAKGGKTPLDLKSLGEMKIELPPPTLTVVEGPPERTKPTFAHFMRNVVVLRGVLTAAVPPDRLDCDFLDLELIPADKTVAKTENGDESVGGPLTDLTLREAIATGHAVLLYSQSQGMKGRAVNRLVHTKLGNGQPDVTRLTTNSPTAPFLIEKEDVPGPDAPKDTPRAINTIRASDATIRDTPGLMNGPQSVLVKGYGKLETRPARDQPVQRTAEWHDRLTMITQGEGTNTWREIRLYGRPEMSDLKAPVATALNETAPAPTTESTEPTKLKAADVITILLTPKAADPNAPEPKLGQPKAPEAFELKQLHAVRDVVLTSPGKIMNADEELTAEFAPTPPAGKVTAKPEPNQEPAPATVAASTSEEQPPAEPAKPKVEPPTTIRAAKIWARLTPKAGTDNAYDIDKVRMDKQVVYHQDPEEGKEIGTDVTGEALDVNRQASGTNSVVVINRARVSRPITTIKRLSNPNAPAADASAARPAKVISEDLAIQGPVIGLDQEKNYAWDRGPGRLTQWTERGKLGGFGPKGKKPIADANAEAAPPDDEYYDPEIEKLASEKVPVTISWSKEMQFFGMDTVHARAKGWPVVAKAFFLGQVRVRTEYQTIDAEEIDAWLDGPVKFSEAGKNKKPADPNVPAPKQPELAKVFARKNVYAISVKRDPKTNQVIQKQVIVCDDLQYDKRTGDFLVIGQGRVYLFDLEAAVLGKDGKPKPTPKGKKAAEPSMVLTQIDFRDRMVGKFAQGDDGSALPSHAEFYGDVQVLRAKVADEYAELDADTVNREMMSISSQELRVISEPANKADGPNHYTMAAFTNAVARDATHTAQGDRITYNSATDLFYLYGTSTQHAVIAEQVAFGQPGSRINGRTLLYNGTTHHGENVEPGSMVMMDTKVGSRPLPLKAKPDEITKKKNSRPNFKLPVSSDKERKGFNGR